ncbi:MAG: hypothetical protein EPO40_12800 [Myxococcaceae bacterium]|nr:MAG: hypothetical protein EPO40_12800 [Myxococcaceae bacterium]
MIPLLRGPVASSLVWLLVGACGRASPPPPVATPPAAATAPAPAEPSAPAPRSDAALVETLVRTCTNELGTAPTRPSYSPPQWMLRGESVAPRTPDPGLAGRAQDLERALDADASNPQRRAMITELLAQTLLSLHDTLHAEGRADDARAALRRARTRIEAMLAGGAADAEQQGDARFLLGAVAAADGDARHAVQFLREFMAAHRGHRWWWTAALQVAELVYDANATRDPAASARSYEAIAHSADAAPFRGIALYRLAWLARYAHDEDLARERFAQVWSLDARAAAPALDLVALRASVMREVCATAAR